MITVHWQAKNGDEFQDWCNTSEFVSFEIAMAEVMDYVQNQNLRAIIETGKQRITVDYQG